MSTQAQSGPLRLGLIGCGTIGRTAAKVLWRDAADKVSIVGVFVRGSDDRPAPPGMTSDAFVHNIDALIERRPTLVLECAGHQALAAYGAIVLEAGIDLLIVSVGALADESLLGALTAAARSGSSRIHVASGAIAGLDWLSAAAIAGLTEVTYRSRKPPAAWAGTPGHLAGDGDRPGTAKVFFRSSVRMAALQYPKNVNVAASVALATLGFDKTQVELISDPALTVNVHEVVASGPAGAISLCVQNKADPENPRTSLITGHSVAHCILRRSSTVVI